MAAGQRIDDHSFWAGGSSRGSVAPMGAKTKGIDGQGDMQYLNDYQDTERAVYDSQKMNQSKMKSHAAKSGYRN